MHAHEVDIELALVNKMYASLKSKETYITYV